MPMAKTRSARAQRGHRQEIGVRVLLASLLLAAAACGPPEPDESDYVTRLIEDREYKDDFFKNAPESPVPLDRRSWMVPLRYYDPDLSYRVPANLAIGEEQPVFDIPTSTGLMRPMRHVGHLEFVLHGESYRLAALLSDGEGLFVPFRDETSRDETYPADATWTCRSVRPASTTSTSTAPTIRRATSTRSSTVRSRRPRTGCRRRCGPASGCPRPRSAACR